MKCISTWQPFTSLIMARFRGAIDPEVLNPFQAVALQILELGIDIVAILGNHDLASKETTSQSARKDGDRYQGSDSQV